MQQFPSMRGKVILLTGGSSGIGKATAIKLAKLGGNVTIVGRDKGRCKAALAEIVRESGNNDIKFMLSDLSSCGRVP